MKQIYLLFLICAFALSGVSAQQNLILIIADDMGKDYCGFYEEAGDTAKMPNIRSLLSQGVRFTRAWATPLCSPTRANMLTGRYSFRTGVGTALSGSGYAELDTAEITIPRLLKILPDKPYATANIGKWHLSRQSPQTLSYPNLMGYDHFEGNFLGELPSYVDWKKVKNGVSSNVSTYATTETTNNAIAWLETIDAEKPFFMWLAFNAPHSPFHKPPDNLHTVPGLTGTQMHINQNTPQYFKAMVEGMDTEIGRLFAWLKQNDKWENTNIIFIGDNGNPRKISQISDTAQGKGTLYEYGINVPFIISGPSVAAPNRVSHALVNATDLFATILDLCAASEWSSAIPDDRPTDAVSLLPILLNQQEEVREWIFSEQFNPIAPDADDGKTMRNKAYKLVSLDNGQRRFYHLALDPLEQNNLLSAPLSPEAQVNYNWLCSRMNELTGTATCNTNVATTGKADENIRVESYPNPGSSELFIRVFGIPPTPVFITAYDGLGRVIAATQRFDQETSIDVHAWPDGLYFLQVGVGERVKYITFVKK